jgi:hypothetical protein
MKKLITLSSGFLLMASCLFAQNERIFHSTGFSIYTDYMQAPVTTYTKNPGTIDEVSYAGQNSGLSIFTFIYNFRYNIMEISDNAALTGSIIPALGLYLSDGYAGNTGIGSLNIPLMAGYEFGAGSTYNSTANMGGFIRFGVEWTKAPLFVSSEGGTDDVEFESSWVEPVVQGGVRYWNKRNKLREIHIKYGFGSGAPDGVNDENGNSLGSAMSIRLSWMLFLNY